jgi:hypothetical protein
MARNFSLGARHLQAVSRSEEAVSERKLTDYLVMVLIRWPVMALFYVYCWVTGKDPDKPWRGQ